jgi:hypothetical protein
MVPTDDGGHIPAIYGDFVKVLSKTNVETLAPHRSTDHAIDFEPSYNLPYWDIYNLSEFELRTLKAYIDANLANKIIQRSSSPVAAPILFAKTKDGGLRLGIDYRKHNKAMVMNQSPLPLLSEMLHRVWEARIFTEVDLGGTYNLIGIKDGDESKMDFRTLYGQFEYLVMPFSLLNSPATFQPYVDDCLRPYIDDFAVCYLHVILIYLTNEQVHEEHFHQALQ